MSGQEVLWKPQPGPQTLLLSCPADIQEIFYGGARGGGKTDGCIGDWLAHQHRWGRAAKGVFFRRVAKNLEAVVERTKELFPHAGARYRDSGGSGTWTFPNGARLKFRHLWDKKAANDYQGHDYTRIYVEEQTQWPDPTPIQMVSATLRSAAGADVRLISTGNPGGAGHNWVKARHISPAPEGFRPIFDKETGMTRVFIPARLEDNLILTSNDPLYEKRLNLVGSAALVKAWRHGIWDIVAGGFFDDLWNPDRHILPTFRPPASWKFFMSFDWGTARPSSLGLYAEVTEPNELKALPGRYFPRGSVIRFGEWYTVERGPDGIVRPDHGLRLTNHQLGAGIVRIMRRFPEYAWKGSVADPSIFTEAGGPSLYDQMQVGAKQAGGKIKFLKAANGRPEGWQAMRQMMRDALPDRPESPGFYVTANCTEWIRTVPILQVDESRPDDLDTKSEDHAADETRYALMRRRGGKIHQVRR